MTDKLLVETYLNENYIVKQEYDDFIIFDIKKNKSVYNKQIEIESIFGESKDLKKIFNNWFKRNKDLLMKDLIKILKSIDYSNGSTKAYTKFFSLIKDSIVSNFDVNFLSKQFCNYYVDTILDSKLKKILSDINMDYVDKIGSNGLFNIKDIRDLLDSEITNIYETLNDKINVWYLENFLNDKIKAFINDCEVKMTDVDWKIIHKHYGSIDVKTPSLYFPCENLYSRTIITKILEEFLNDEQIEMTEKILKNF
jgi:hypothetical protein